MSRAVQSSYRQYQAGLTLVEVLVAMTLLTILLVPALQALNVAFLGSDIHRLQSDNHHRLMARLETVVAEPYSTLQAAAADPNTPGSYSDPVATAERLLVYIAPYDLDNADADDDPFTGADEDVLWVRVAIEGGAQSFATLRTR